MATLTASTPSQTPTTHDAFTCWAGTTLRRERQAPAAAAIQESWRFTRAIS
jgi:hypothetical protein